VQKLEKTLLANRSLEVKKLIANSSSKQTIQENVSTETKATLLIQTLGADNNWLRWYCKIINTLSEATIQNILEGARKAQYPDRYFAKAASIELRKIS